jgi:hydroxyacylglutathione hydrolase
MSFQTIPSGYLIHKITAGSSNAWLVTKDDFSLLVDTTNSRNQAQLFKTISGITGGKPISLLALTHSHYDHCRNAAAIQELYHSKVIIHQSEAGNLHKGFTPLPRGTYWFSDKLTALGNKHIPQKYVYQAVLDCIAFSKEYQIEGHRIRIIHTPGHSCGSASILVDNDIAIVGDALFGVFKSTIYPPFADDKIELIISWQRLLHTGCRLFLPGHGGAVKREQLFRHFNRFKGRYPEELFAD